MIQILSKTIFCPVCKKGKILTTDEANGIVSCQCPKCGQYFRANLKTRKAIKATAVPNR